MNVIIVGGGQVGGYIAGLLIENGNNAIVIENKEKALQALKKNGLKKENVLTGDGTDALLLEKAGVRRCNALVCTTGNDETNLAVAMMAKFEYDVPKVIARVNNPKNAWLFNAGMGVDVKISERTLREIYLRGFEIAVKEGQPTAIMSSYNLVNGVHAANSKDLCTRIARKEWGFDGVIMSDWNTTVPEDGSVAWKCAAAGNDIIMPGNAEDAESIRNAYRNGDLTEEEIRSCAGRILELISQLA